MKALALVLLILWAVHLTMHRGHQRTPAAKVAWANWFTEHRDGGGV